MFNTNCSAKVKSKQFIKRRVNVIAHNIMIAAIGRSKQEEKEVVVQICWESDKNRWSDLLESPSWDSLRRYWFKQIRVMHMDNILSKAGLQKHA